MYPEVRAAVEADAGPDFRAPGFDLAARREEVRRASLELPREDVAQPQLGARAEDVGQPRVSQVAVDQEHALAQLGEADREVRRDERLALARLGGRHGQLDVRRELHADWIAVVFQDLHRDIVDQHQSIVADGLAAQ